MTNFGHFIAHWRHSERTPKRVKPSRTTSEDRRDMHKQIDNAAMGCGCVATVDEPTQLLMDDSRVRTGTAIMIIMQSLSDLLGDHFWKEAVSIGSRTSLVEGFLGGIK